MGILLVKICKCYSSKGVSPYMYITWSKLAQKSTILKKIKDLIALPIRIPHELLSLLPFKMQLITILKSFHEGNMFCAKNMKIIQLKVKSGSIQWVI